MKNKMCKTRNRTRFFLRSRGEGGQSVYAAEHSQRDPPLRIAQSGSKAGLDKEDRILAPLNSGARKQTEHFHPDWIATSPFQYNPLSPFYSFPLLSVSLCLAFDPIFQRASQITPGNYE